MGLRQIVMNAAVKAIKATGDIAVSVTIVHTTPGNYDSNTGRTADTVEQKTIQVPLLRLLENELGWFPVPDRTRRVVVPSLLIPFVPDNNDQVLIGGERWEVKKIRGVPGDAVYILYLETPGPA